MLIPDYQSIMLPLLKFTAKRGILTINEAVYLIANEFGLSTADCSELLPSGNQTIIKNRIGWARTYLKKLGC